MIQSYTCLSILSAIWMGKSISAIALSGLSDEVQSDENYYENINQFDDNIYATKQFEHSPLTSLSINQENSFKHNFHLPELEDYSQYSVIPPQQAFRYTSTPTDTYQVSEAVYEPKPIPQISTFGTVSPNDESGSLGIVNYLPDQFKNKQHISGGLHVVPPPQLGSSEAFDSAFNNFNFKPLDYFFEHK